MKGMPKPYRMRKPYKRKKGGPRYLLSGDFKSQRASLSEILAPVQSLGVVEMVKTKLEKMGFNVKH